MEVENGIEDQEGVENRIPGIYHTFRLSTTKLNSKGEEKIKEAPSWYIDRKWVWPMDDE